MRRLIRVLRIALFAVMLAFAIGGVPVLGNIYERKREDLYDNETKIEYVETNDDENNLSIVDEVK